MVGQVLVMLVWYVFGDFGIVDVVDDDIDVFGQGYMKDVWCGYQCEMQMFGQGLGIWVKVEVFDYGIGFGIVQVQQYMFEFYGVVDGFQNDVQDIVEWYFIYQ